jgi:hypothetical protein
MNAIARRAQRIALTLFIALGCSAAQAQALATYGDAPAAEAAGAAAAANRTGNGGPFTARNDDAQLLGGPAGYGEVYQAQTVLDRQQQKVPAAAANTQAQGATPVEHMLANPGTPQQGGAALAGAGNGGNAGNAKRNYATGAQARTPANAALQLYGDGTASGAVRHDIYKSPW